MPKNDTRTYVTEAQRNQKERENSYRERALKLFPWICGRCAREFSGKRLKELTVHHKDSNHNNNPQDGSNWELLCIYCHENEHSREQVAEAYSDDAPLQTEAKSQDKEFSDNPFAGLADLMKSKKE